MTWASFCKCGILRAWCNFHNKSRRKKESKVFRLDDSKPLKEWPREFRHLHKNASVLRCDTCGRTETDAKPNDDCNFPQPSGGRCQGILKGQSNERNRF